MRYLKVSIFILISLSLSRFIPHPPNFTSLIALSFYLPAFFGRKYIPIILTSFLITDLVIRSNHIFYYNQFWSIFIWILWLWNELLNKLLYNGNTVF